MRNWFGETFPGAVDPAFVSCLNLSFSEDRDHHQDQEAGKEHHCRQRPLRNLVRLDQQPLGDEVKQGGRAK